eukprot:gene2786-5490_t
MSRYDIFYETLPSIRRTVIVPINSGSSLPAIQIERTLDQIIPYRPIFSLSITFLQWFSFLFGLFYMIGIDNIKITAMGPISPPNTELWYIFIDGFPQCEDRRHEIWRLFTLQFVHAGFLHIISNTILSLPYGIIYERIHGNLLTAFIYQMGVLCGTLCHANLWAYNPLFNVYENS